MIEVIRRIVALEDEELDLLLVASLAEYHEHFILMEGEILQERAALQQKQHDTLNMIEKHLGPQRPASSFA